MKIVILWSTIWSMPTKRTTACHIYSLHIEKTTTYSVGNLGPDLGQALQMWCS